MESLTFGKMWDLVTASNVLPTSREFTNELLMSIFWEESQFRNIEQINFKSGGRMRAFGFGQVQGESMEVVNALHKAKRHHYNKEAVLKNPVLSVDLTADYLCYLRTGGLSSTKRSVLCKYGAGTAEASSSTTILATVDSWLACEKMLLAARGNFSEEGILKSLKAASPPASQRGDVPPEIADGGYSIWGF